MNSNAGVSKPMLWTGRVMSAIAVLLVTFGGVVKVMKVAGIIEGMARAGWPERLTRPVGVIELFCVVVYLIPRTNVLGAILMTALLGGATATNFRIGDPSLPLPIIVGMLAWGGLYLRDTRIRELIPLRRTGS
jgi:hypothetical protein